MKSYLQNCSVNGKAFYRALFPLQSVGRKRTVKPSQVMGLVDPLNTRIKSLGKVAFHYAHIS